MALRDATASRLRSSAVWKAADLVKRTVTVTEEFDEQDSDSLALILADATRAIQRVFSERIPDIGISAAHWPCLRVLRNGDGITQRELAERVKITAATLVPTIRWLASRGYVARKADGTDRRKIRIFLTAKGRATCAKVAPEVRAINAAAAKNMGDVELEKFKQSLRRIRLNVLARDW